MECWCASTIKSWLLILMMILILMVCGIEGGCIQEERKALLQIKTSLIHSDFPSPLPSWVDDGGECCDWERVNCNTTTGHVIDLSLSNMMDGCERIWPLNSSLFLKFKELTSLNLSWNCLDDGIVNTGLGRLSSLKRLEILDLSFNSLTNGIFPSLNALTSLRVLDLGYNYLKGNFPALELAHLTNLEELDLSFNWLNGTPSIQELSHLRDLKVLLLSGNFFNGTLPTEALTSFHNLEVLDLSGNNFVGRIPSTIQALSSLRAVSFAYNNFNGSLSDHGLCELKNLHELDLSYNMFNGNLPKCFSRLSSLKLLDISSNRFTGTIIPSVITNLTSLEYVDFSNNRFEGSFSFSLFSNHPKLEAVQFVSNNNIFEVETEEPIGWIPMFQLKVLVLSSCNVNRPKGSVVPEFLLHQHKLQVLDLSHNSLVGPFPSWLIEKNTLLEALNLRNNLVGGIMCMPRYGNANTRWLDVSRGGPEGVPAVPPHGASNSRGPPYFSRNTLYNIYI